jgi:hypothetical protein
MSSDPLQKDIDAVLGTSSPDSAGGAKFGGLYDQLDSQFSSRFGRSLFVTAGDNAEHRKLHPGGARDIRAKDLSDDERKFVVGTARGLGLNVRDYSWVKQPYTTPTGIKISGPHIHLDADRRAQSSGGSNLNDDVVNVLRPSTPKAAMPDRSFNPDVQSVTAAPSTTSPDLASADHPLFSAALNEVMQITGVGDAKAREFLASKPGKRKYPGLPLTPVTAPTAAISPAGASQSVAAAEATPAATGTRAPLLTNEDLTPAAPAQSEPLADSIAGVASQASAPAARKPRTKPAAKPQQPAANPTADRIKNLDEQIGRLQKLQLDPRMDEATVAAVMQPLLIERGKLQRGELETLDPNLTTQIHETNRRYQANEEARRQEAEAQPTTLGIVAQAGAQTLEQTMRPFAVASTAVAGLQRQAADILTNNPGGGHDWKSLWDAVARKATSGEDTPGYEQPVGELYKLAYEHFGGDTNGEMFKLAHSTLSGITDPVQYGAVDLVAGEGVNAVKNLRKPAGMLAEETAARDLAGAIKTKTASKPQLSSPQPASADLHSDVEAVLGTSSPEKPITPEQQPITTKKAKPNDHTNLTAEHLRSEAAPSNQETQQQAAAPVKQEEIGGQVMGDRGRVSAEPDAQHPTPDTQPEKAPAQASVRPPDTLTRTEQPAPAPLSRGERASLTSDKLQAAIENAPDHTRQSLESLQRVGRLIDAATARKAPIENVANLELRQSDLLGRDDVRQALGLEPIKGERATDRLPVEPEPRPKTANKISAKEQPSAQTAPAKEPELQLSGKNITKNITDETPAAIAATSDATRLQSEFDAARLKLDDLNRQRRNGESVGQDEIAKQIKLTGKLASDLKLAKIAESKIATIQQQRATAAGIAKAGETITAPVSPEPAVLSKATPEINTSPLATKKQISALRYAAKPHGVNVEAEAMKRYGVKPEAMTRDQASAFAGELGVRETPPSRTDNVRDKYLELTKEKPATEAPAQVETLAAGKETTAATERGTEIKAKYAIAEADSLITSHDQAGNPNPDYPQEVQPRDRSRIASEDQVDNIARNLKPEFLAHSPKAGEGAPIIGPDHVVESGNGRTMGIRRAYEQIPESAAKYKNYLLDHAEEFGLDRAAIEKAKKPVLVRIRQTPVDRAEFAREANEGSVAGMSAVEQARSDANRLTPELMAAFHPSDAGEILTSANRDFIGRFVDEVVGPAERGRYMTNDGQLSQEGVGRIRNAVFAKAYADTPEGVAALEKLAESTDNNVRNITTAMLHKAGRFAALKDAIEAGSRYPLDLTGDLGAAMKKLSNLRESGVSVDEYLRQGALFGDDLTPLQKEILSTFDQNKRSTKAINEILDNYLIAVERAGDPKQASFFSKIEPTKEMFFEAATKEATGGKGQQAGLFAEEPGTQAGSGLRAQADQGGQGAASASEAGNAGQPVEAITESAKRAELISSIKTKLGKSIKEERGSFSQHKLTPEQIKENAILPDLIELGKSYIREAKGKSSFEVFQRFRSDIESVFADRMEAIKPHLMGVWQAAKDSAEAEQKQTTRPATQAKLIETAPPAEPASPKLNLTEEQRAENANAFDEAMQQKKLGLGPLKQNAVDLLNAPRAIMASADLSAPLRQGAILTLTEPKAGIAAARDMFRAISAKGFENVKAELANAPRAQLAEQSGLYQATKAAGQSSVALSLREEAFMSRLMGKLPIIKQSEQAYVAYLDRLRMDTFSKYADALDRAAIKGKTVIPKDYEDIAHFVNLATGRGDLPAVLDSLAPVLNGVFFSPRYAMSRIQVLNPRTYWKMSPAARSIAMKKMAEFTGVVATTLGLAKLAGADVSLDPDSADFLKIKAGNTRYDVLAGFQQYLRFAFQMSKGFYNNATGNKNPRNHEPLDVATKFVRSKLAPVASYVTDAAAGKDFKGEKFSPGKGIAERLAPMVAKDFYEAWQQDGAAGAAKTAPGFFGVGVQTYKQKPKPLTLEDVFK